MWLFSGIKVRHSSSGWAVLALWMIGATAQAETWQSPLLQDHPLVGQIIALPGGEVIDRETLLKDLQAARFVLIGEKHDNPDHHVLEQHLLSGLTREKSRSTAVVFEMLDDSQTEAVRGLTADMPLETMKSRLAWPARGWDWSVYGPLFRQTLQAGAQLLPGNVSNTQLKQVYQSGKEALTDPRFSTLDVIKEEQQRVMLDQVFESHCEMMPRDSLGPMVTVQVAKDASMAAAMSESKVDQTILIAGGFHASYELGVPRHLQARQPDADIRVVMLVEVAQDAPALADYLEGEVPFADYVWFTPQATDKDYCADLRKQHGKKK